MEPGTNLIRARYSRSWRNEVTRLEIVTVRKVYKNGNFILEGDPYQPPQQWKPCRKDSDGPIRNWQPTCDLEYQVARIELFPMSAYERLKVAFDCFQERNRRGDVQRYLSGLLLQSNHNEPLSADKLARINAILNEPEAQI